jgi:hypothetical protein
VSGIFATQFNTVNPYDPVGLDTGTPAVGITLGKKTPKRPPREDTPSRVPPGGGAAAGAEAGAAMASGNSASASNAMSQSAANSMAMGPTKNQTYEKLMHLSAEDTAGGNPATIKIPAASNVNMPKHSGADATPPKQNSNSGGGFLGWASHTFNDVVHNPVVSDVMHFGDPFKTSGVAGAISPAQPPSNVIQPSRVYNPSRPSAGEISQGGPRTIQGQVQGPESVGNGAGPRALPRAYTTQQDFIDMMRGSGASHLNSTQFDTTPWYDQIPNDISSIGEDALSAL